MYRKSIQPNKNTVASTLIAALFFSAASASFSDDHLCGIINPSVSLGIPNPIVETENYWVEGSFSAVRTASGLFSAAGTFSFEVYADVRGEKITWSIDEDSSAIVFQTEAFQYLKLRDLTVSLDGCKVDSSRLLVTLLPNDLLRSSLEEAHALGFTEVYVQNGESMALAAADLSYLLDPVGVGSDLFGLAYDLSTVNLSYVAVNPLTSESFDFSDFTIGSDYSVAVQVEACAQCIPEPSGAMLGVLGLVGLLGMRRRRVSR
jgi:MYXO-CTERM domain-containing protein